MVMTRRYGMRQMNLAVESGYWPFIVIIRIMQNRASQYSDWIPKIQKFRLEDFLYNENRFNILKKAEPETASQIPW